MNSIQISNPFPSTLNPPPTTTFNKAGKLFIARAAADDNKSPTKDEEKGEPSSTTTTTAVSDKSFENRLAQVRLKYRSGEGKKAEKRRSRKGGSSKKSATVLLPPVPLKEAVNAAGLKVDVGFSPYSEMLNGRVAALGLAALLLVELGSGRGILSYHAPPILFIQVYTVAAASALFIKFEKERISIWPEKAPAEPKSEAN